MKLQAYNNYQSTFKSVYPVYHWVKNGSIWLPESNNTNLHTIQRKFVNMLNKHLPYCKSKNADAQKIVDAIANIDNDYANNPHVRSFYPLYDDYITDKNGKIIDYRPSVYLLTGDDAVYFSRTYGQNIGKSKGALNKFSSDAAPYFELNNACQEYFKNGYDYVKTKASRFFIKQDNSAPAELHTICKGNNPNEFSIIKINFFPKHAQNNPMLKILG